MQLLLRLSVLALVALAVSGTEDQQDRRRLLFSTRNRPNILSRRFTPESSDTTTTPSPEEKTTTARSRVRLPSRRPSLRFGIRPTSPLKTKIEQQRAEKEEKDKTETEVISEPHPSQEFVAFTTEKASHKGEQENKPEPEILTKPIPGQEFVAFQASHPSAQDSIITVKDGEVVYVSLDKSPEEAALETKTEDLGLPEDSPLPDAQKVAELDAILITPDEILPIEEIAPVTEVAADYYVDVIEEDLAAHLPQEQVVPIVTPSPLKNATALEPEVETLISVVTSHPMKEVEGESMHVKHHMEFEHSHTGPENDTVLDQPIAHAEPTPELLISEAEVDIVPVTEFLIETDYTADNVSINELPIKDNVTIRHEVHVLLDAPSKRPVPTQETKVDIETKITSQETITEAPFDTTELPLVAEGEVSNIEILSAASKDQQNLPVNDLYGKYFDESDLDFGKGTNNEDKLLFPAETEQKVRSKIEIKEVNGQLYEYEYIYYYDDEYPLYDYEDGAPVDVEPSTSPATTTTSSTTTSTTTTTTTTTPRPTTTPKPTTPKPTTTTTARPSRSSLRGSSRARGRRPVVDDQEVNVIEEPARTFGRSRGGLSQSIRTSSRTRNNFRGREKEVNSLDNTVHGVTVEEDKLPAQTRFPPRSTTPTPTRSRFREREPLFKETSQTGLDEQKEIPLIPGVTGLHSPQGRQSTRGGRRFNAETPAPDTETESNILAQEELTTEVIPTSTVSPVSLSVSNLYAFSRAFDAEEMGDATTEIPQAYDYDTEIPLEYQDLYYDYVETATEFPSYLPEEGTEIPEPQTEPEPAAEPEPEPEPEPSTEEPTTSSTTTTTTTTTTPAPTTTTTEATRGRGRFSSRSRGTSRFSTSRRSQTKSSSTTTEEPDTVSEAPSVGSRFRPSRFGSTRNRASNNRFRVHSGNNGANEPNSENTVDDTSTTAGQTETTTRSSLGHRTRFNRPRVSSFRTQQSAKTENEVTKPTPSETPAARNRPRLPSSRPGLFRNRFRGRGTTAADEVSTEPTEHVAAEAPVEEAVIEEVEGEVEISTESSTAPSTTAVPANKRTRGRKPLTRHRFGTRGSPRNPQQSTAADTQGEHTDIADETPAVQTQRVPSRTRGRLTRPLASRLSSRLNPRIRGSALAEKTESEVEVTQIDELPTENQAQEEQPQGDLTEQEVSVGVPEETTQDGQSNGQQSSTRGTNGGRNILGRFRNRSQSVTSSTRQPPKIRDEPASNNRRSGLSSLFNRRRRVRPGSATTETPHTQESEIPIDESHSSDSTLATDTELAEGEPEPTPEEAVPTSDTFLEVAEEVPVEEPTADEGPKEENPPRRFSFFNNRRRNRN